MDTTRPVTAEELLRVRMPGKRLELVRGTLIVREPAGYLHGLVAARLTNRLMSHVEANDLGDVLAAETGFKLAGDPDTVRAPDVAFIGRGRLTEPRPAAYAELAPDLVVEVQSPNDRPGEVLAKVAEWLEAGTLTVWTLDPIRRAGRVYRADGSQTLLSEDDSLDGEDVVPGFRCPLRELLR